MRKTLWSPAEDEMLKRCVERYGTRNWKEIAKITGLGRCPKSCRLRWFNYLRPDLKRCPFTGLEAALLLHLHACYGNRWSKIASHLPGRSDNDVKNFWHTFSRRTWRSTAAAAAAAHCFYAAKHSTTTSINSSCITDQCPVSDLRTPAPAADPADITIPNSARAAVSDLDGDGHGDDDQLPFDNVDTISSRCSSAPPPADHLDMAASANYELEHHPSCCSTTNNVSPSAAACTIYCDESRHRSNRMNPSKFPMQRQQLEEASAENVDGINNPVLSRSAKELPTERWGSSRNEVCKRHRPSSAFGGRVSASSASHAPPEGLDLIMWTLLNPRLPMPPTWRES